MRAMFVVVTSWIRRAPLWPRVVAAVSLCFLALLGIIGVLTTRAADQSRDRILQERLVIGEMAAHQTDATLEHGFGELERAASSIVLRTAGAEELTPSTALQQVMQDLDNVWANLYLLDANGAVIAAARGDASAQAVGALAPAGTDPSATGSRKVSAPHLDPLNGTPVVVLAIPVGGGSDSRSMLAGAMDLSRLRLSDSLGDAKSLGKTGHAELFDSRGRVIASTEPFEFLAPGEHASAYLKDLRAKAPIIETIPVEQAGHMEADQPGDKHIMAVVPLSSVPWGVAVGGSESETLSPVSRLRNEMLLLGAVSLAIMWFLSLGGARLLVRPVRALTQAANGIAGGDLNTPIHVGEGGEIGQLGQSLDDMRLRLRASLNEIEERDRELERRVAERTLEVQTLFKELQHKEELRGRLLENVISAQEDERKRIARELHDETGQALTGIIMSLEVAEDALSREPETVRPRLQRAKSLASESIAGIRRLVVDLRPAALDDLGLVPAIRAFAGSRLEEKGIHVEIQVAGLSDRLAPPVEICLFRVAQEAVTNVVRHSGAHAARIELKRENGFVSLLVRDDGHGFDVDEISNSADPGRALGLAGMEERVSLLGGRLAVESAPGSGTTVSARIPVEGSRS